MKNIKKLLTATFAIVILCTMNFAQTDAKIVQGKHFASVIIKGKQANQAILCLSSEEKMLENYRLKVWQLMQGQTGVQTMRSNQPIVTVTEHAINTKGTGLNNGRTSKPDSDSDAIKVCSEALQQGESTTTSKKPHAINTKGTGSTNGRSSMNVQAVTIDNFPACAKGSSCNYEFTVEALNADGSLVNPKAKALTGEFKCDWSWDIEAETSE
jgi:hypothetical protein